MEHNKQAYITEYNRISEEVSQLETDLLRMRTDPGKLAIQKEIDAYSDRLSTMRTAKYVQVVEGPSKDLVYEVLREEQYRGGLIYIIWQSRSNPEDDYNWLDEENVIQIKLPFQPGFN
ncbi:hypothetical protein [Paenibacillus taichungensis]|uniref:hypothetical protein n=1 Tax=Paenibacillus taichungensis TaxID=484184 RepID=UPI0035D756E0